MNAPVILTLQVGDQNPASKWVAEASLDVVEDIQDNALGEAKKGHDGAYAIVTMGDVQVCKTPISFTYMSSLREEFGAEQQFYCFNVPYLPAESISFPEFVELALDNFAIDPDKMDEYAELKTNRERMEFFSSLRVEDVEDTYFDPIDEEGGYHGPVQLFLRGSDEPVTGAFISPAVDEPVLVRRHGARKDTDPVAIVLPDASVFWNEYAAGWADSEGEPVGWEDRDYVLLEPTNYVALTEEGEEEVTKILEAEAKM